MCVDARELWKAYRKMYFPKGKPSDDDDDIPIHFQRLEKLGRTSP